MENLIPSGKIADGDEMEITGNLSGKLQEQYQPWLLGITVNLPPPGRHSNPQIPYARLNGRRLQALSTTQQGAFPNLAKKHSSVDNAIRSIEAVDIVHRHLLTDVGEV